MRLTIFACRTYATKDHISLLRQLLLPPPFYGPLTRVSWYQKKHLPTHTYRGHQSSVICFLHLLWSIASPQFDLRAWQSFCTACLQVHFGLPLGLASFTSYSIHFSPNHCLFFTTHAHMSITCFAVVLRLCSLILDSLNSLLGTQPLTVTPHIYLGLFSSVCRSSA